MNLLNQMILAGRLDRSFYRSLVFDNYATGNAVVVIALVGALPHILTFSLLEAVLAMLSSLIRAALVTGAIWAVSVYIFKRYGNPRTTFRMVGFANVGFLPLVFTTVASTWWLTTLFKTAVLLITAVWVFMTLRTVALSQFDLEHPENSFAASSGLLGWFLYIILGL